MKQATRLFPVLLSLLAALLIVPISHASTVFPGSGSFAQTAVFSVTVSQADGIQIIHETFGLAFTGAFAGTTVGTVTIIINTMTNTGTFSGENNFTGTVTTASGAASGTILAPFSASFVGSSFQGQFALFGGTGGLAGVEGQGTIEGSLSPSFTGTYSVLFTPS
jgi:hypothetical protein